MGRIIHLDELDSALSKNPTFIRGCVVDTNLLFAADYDSHHWNTEAIELGELLVAYEVPIFSNATIRSELLELKRQVLLTESLLDFYSRTAADLAKRSSHLFNKLKALKDRTVEAERKGEHFFYNADKLKECKESFDSSLTEDAWYRFCEAYLSGKLETEWAGHSAARNIAYLTGDEMDFFDSPLEWSDMIALSERNGIGISDAMILNFFECSSLSLLATADREVAAAVSRMPGDKTCAVPWPASVSQ